MKEQEQNQDPIQSILAEIRQLPLQDQARLKDELYASNETSVDLDAVLTSTKFSQGRRCPHCGGDHVHKNGHRKDGSQKYRCVKCGKNFMITTNTIFQGTRKSLSTWNKYLNCMEAAKSLKETEQECDISHGTAFTWRHKLLDAMRKSGDDIKLVGIVEADEKYMPISYKGNARHFQENNDRRPRKRGSEAVKQGLSNDLVCVPCAVDNAGHCSAQIAKTGKCSSKAISKAFEGKIVPQAVLCSDGDKSYKSFAKVNDNILVQIKAGKKSIKGYNIQRVNNYHSQLETFMRRFNGVSSKYLNNYLIWHNAIKYCKKYAQNRIKLMLDTASSAQMKVCASTLSKRAEIPILA